MREKPVDGFGNTPNVPEFLNHDSPSRCPPGLSSPPLFPRVVQGCSNVKSGVSNPTRVPDLVSMLQMASPELIDGEDGDNNGHHMEVVSGWSVLNHLSGSNTRADLDHSSNVDNFLATSALFTFFGRGRG